MVYPTRQIDYAHILKIPITKTQHSRQHMLNISDKQSRGGSTGGGGGGGGGGLAPTFGYNTQGCLTAVGNRCGHKKIFGHVAPPPPPPPQHLLIQNPMYQTDSTCLQSPTYQTGSTCLSDRQHMLTKPMYQRGSTCLQNPTYQTGLK